MLIILAMPIYFHIVQSTHSFCSTQRTEVRKTLISAKLGLKFLFRLEIKWAHSWKILFTQNVYHRLMKPDMNTALHFPFPCPPPADSNASPLLHVSVF